MGCGVHIHFAENSLRVPGSESSPSGTGLSDQPGFVRFFWNYWTVRRGERWKGYSGTKTAPGKVMRSPSRKWGKKGNRKNTEKDAISSVFSEVPVGTDSLAHHLCRLWGSTRGKGQELQASGKMTANDLGARDWMQTSQEASSLDIVWGILE